VLLSCPKCGLGFSSWNVRPEAGTAICDAHGEVRPRVGYPPVGEAASPGTHWSATWSRRESSYEYEAVLHESMGAVFAPFGWQGGFVSAHPIELVITLPLRALTYVPRLLSPRIRIDPRRVRFGLRSLRLKDVGAFVVTATSGRTHLTASANDVVLLDCQRAPDDEALRALRDEMNEALFVVQYQSPLPAEGTPYRG